MKSIFLKNALAIIFVIFLSTFSNSLMASHIPGANITYTCNPANPLQYTFTLTAFVRCPNTHPATMDSYMFTMTNSCGFTNPVIPNFVQVGVAEDVNQLCPTAISNCSGGTHPGIWKYTYQATITLPANCANWTINYNLCCRDAATNMSNGSGNDMSTSTSFNSLASPCNNSPVVTSAPIPYACTNTPFTYCLTTADPEGDSLYFRMVNPTTAWGTPIPHLAGYSTTAPLAGFVLDPLTGCFTFNQPTIGNYVVAIAIEEYNSAGVLISTIIHDFQVQVLNCTNTPPVNPISSITNTSGDGTQTGPNSISACMGESFCFDVIFQDAVNPTDILTITTDALTLFPGATFTQTGTNPVTGTFCWTVVPGNTGNVVTFVAEDNGCPVMGTNAFGVNIDIIQGVYAGPDISVCGGIPVQLNATGGSTFNWSPATGLSCTNCPNPIANPSVTTIYTVTGVLGTSCSNTDQITVNVENVPPTATISGNIGICGASGSNTLTASGGSRFLWNNGATTSSISVSPTTTTQYSVTVTNFVGGCEAYDTVSVVVSTAPVSNLRDITICNGNSTTLTASGGGTYLWSTGATTADITVTPLVTTPYYVTVTVGTCAIRDTAIVTVTPSSAPIITCPSDTTIPQCVSTFTFDTPIALDYCAASPCISNPIADVLTAFNSNGTAIAGAIPNPYTFNLDMGVTATYISDGGGDMYDGGNYLNTNLGANIPYTGGVVSTSAAFGGGSYFTQKYNNLFVMVANLNGVNSFSITGNNGADGSGTADGFTYTVTVGCLSYDVFVKRVHSAFDPSINQVFIIPSGSGATHSFSTNTDNTQHDLNGLAGVDRLYYLLFAGSGGYAYTNAEIQAAVLDFLLQSNTTGGGVAQAPVTQIAGPASGSVFPLGTTTVTFQATGVSGISTCSFDVTVTTTTGPTIICRSDTTVSECASIVDFDVPTATDLCGGGCANIGIADALTNFNSTGTAVAAAIPSPYNFNLDGVGGATGTNISDGGGDMYDGGNFLNTNLGTNIPYTGGAVSTSAAFGGGSYFTHKFNNLFVMVANLNGVNSFSISGNNGADGGGVANGFTYSVTVGCLTYDVFVKRVNSAGDPSINQVFIIPAGSGATHTFSTNTDNGQHDLTGLAGVDRLYYMLFAGTGGFAYSDAQIQAAVLNFLTQIDASSGSGSSVTVTQIAGLPSGSTFPVGTNTITFRATNAGGQTADCSFNIIVVPGIGPIINCRTDTTVAVCNAVVTFNTPVATDPCNAPCVSSPIASVLSDFNSTGTAIAGAIPSPFNFSLDLGATATNISDGGSDMYDGGNFLNTNLATNIPYTGGAVLTHAGFGGASYFTQKYNNLFVMVANLNGINSFSITGNNGADGGGVVNGFTYSVTVGCMTYDVFVKRINSAGDPSINQVFIIPSGSGATHSFSTNTNDGLHTLTGLATVDRLYYLLFAGTGGFAYTNAQVQAAVLNFLTQVNASSGAGGGGVSVAQIAGLASGSTFPVGTNTVTFRATSLTSGLTADCSFNVVVQPGPTASISGTTSICSGSNTTLTAAGGLTYLWNTGATSAAITVSPMVATPYYVTVTDANNCSDSASISTIINTASTVPTIVGIVGTICPNTNVTLSASGGTAGTGSVINWYSGPNGTGTLLGTGASIVVAPLSSMTVYARREGTCNTTADDATVVNTKTYIYAADGTTTSTYCTDNAGWHHFYVGDDIILSLMGNIATAGTMTVTIRDNGAYYLDPGNTALCATGWNPGEAQFEMERNWNIEHTGTLSGTYDVRYYFEPNERQDVIDAANAWIAAYPACGYTYKYPNPNGWFWFKNQGSAYSAPDYDDDATFLMLNSAGTGTTVNGINWSTMTGVTNFSGGTGAVVLIPTTLLPVEWQYFTGHTEGTINKLEWATGTEENTVHFDVQRSKDGINFETIGNVNAAGFSNEAQAYNFDDLHPFIGLNYYRLNLHFGDGVSEFSEVIVLEIDDKGRGYSFYPNPAQDEVFYQFSTDASEKVQIEVIDVLGRILSTKIFTTAVGANNLRTDMSTLVPGAYNIRVTHLLDGKVHSTKIIKK
jgi:hypothetical protein